MFKCVLRVFSIFLITWALPAFANFVGNDTQNFNPTADGLDFVTVHSSRTTEPGFFNLGFFAVNAANTLPTGVDSNVTFSDLNLSYGLFSRFSLGLNFSFLMSQSVSRDIAGAQFASTGLNEIRLTSKYTIKERGPWGWAGILSANLNQARNNPFTGTNSGPTVNFETAVDRRIGKAVAAVNFGYRLRDSGKPIAGSVFEPLPNQYIASLAASYDWIPNKFKPIAEVYAAKAEKAVAFVDGDSISSEILIGAEYQPLKIAHLDFGAGKRLGNGLFTPDWRVFVGVNLDLDFNRSFAPAAQRPVVHHTTYRVGYQPEDIDALKEVPFDDMMATHEFRLRTTVPDGDFEGDRPPFEVIRLNGFEFDSASSTIKPEHQAMLRRLARYLSTGPEVYKVRVEGHTDAAGKETFNKSLSQARAEAVKLFIENAVDSSQIPIEAVGYGTSRPVSENRDALKRGRNRRVEIRILRRMAPAPESKAKSST